MWPAAVAAQRTDLPCPEEGQDEGQEEACNAARAERQRELYGVEPIERLHRAGVQVRRVFYVDNRGWDAGLLSFLRAPGQAPQVSFQPARRAGAIPPPLVADLPAETWQEALARSRHFDRGFQPLPPTDAETICLHGWGYHVEASDPAWGDEPATLRRRTDAGCVVDSPTPEYARALSDLAVVLFPACMALDRDHYRNAVTRLNACAQLSGDRIAAAEVRNAINILIGNPEPADVREVQRIFGESVSLDWQGERAAGRTAAAERWLRGLQEHAHAGFRTGRINGETAERVTVEGDVFYHVSDPSPRSYRAPVTMIWTRDLYYDPVIERVTVGPFERTDD